MRTVEDKVPRRRRVLRPRVQAENPLLTSMRAAVTKAEDQLTKAQAAGDARRISEAEANLDHPPGVARRGREVRVPALRVSSRRPAPAVAARRSAAGRAGCPASTA